MAECFDVPRVCQPAGTRESLVLDYTSRLENRWAPKEVRVLDEVFRPTLGNGFQYRVTAPGQSKQREPYWRGTGADGPAETAGTVYQDGSCTVVAEAVNNASLSNTIQSSTWSGPAEVTIDGEGMQTAGGEQKTFAFIEAAIPGTYRIRNDLVLVLNGQTMTQFVDVEIH